MLPLISDISHREYCCTMIEHPVINLENFSSPCTMAPDAWTSWMLVCSMTCTAAHSKAAYPGPKESARSAASLDLWSHLVNFAQRSRRIIVTLPLEPNFHGSRSQIRRLVSAASRRSTRIAELSMRAALSNYLTYGTRWETRPHCPTGFPIETWEQIKTLRLIHWYNKPLEIEVTRSLICNEYKDFVGCDCFVANLP